MMQRAADNRAIRRLNREVETRVRALDEALEAGRGWLSQETIEAAEEQSAIARARLNMSFDHTVVAIAGPTGAGKSSLLNTLTGTTSAQVSSKRPTTAQPQAVVFEPAHLDNQHDSAQLLDWLEIPQRHYISVSDTARAAKKLTSLRLAWRKTEASEDTSAAEETTLRQGLILVDLPDFDSIMTAHRVISQRLTQRADAVIWVTDPQKYADEAMHAQLRDFHNNTDMYVVLNQIDRLTKADTEQCLADLRRILAQHGNDHATVVGVSTVTGEGISTLGALLERTVERRTIQANTLTAHIQHCAQLIYNECGNQRKVSTADRLNTELVTQLSHAAGVDSIVDAVYDSSLRRSHIATAWPLTAWIARLRRDPLRTLGLSHTWGSHTRPQENEQHARSTDHVVVPRTVRSSRGFSHTGTQARALTAVRTYVDQSTRYGPEQWRMNVSEHVTHVDIVDELDAAVVHAPTITLPRARWWGLISALNKTFLAVLTLGLGWLTVLAIAAYLRIEVPSTPNFEGFPIPTLLTVAGLFLGVCTALIARVLSVAYARKTSRTIAYELHKAIHDVAHKNVIEQVQSARKQLETCALAALVAAR
ncbi:GTPase [Timonella sp. A28]|uniref:GTPase n=1 Tax=Timonella sp. A28 TaxID=3442640 RepID=UPI003EB8539A